MQDAGGGVDHLSKPSELSHRPEELPGHVEWQGGGPTKNTFQKLESKGNPMWKSFSKVEVKDSGGVGSAIKHRHP